jgi:hypothetical protein
LIELQDQNNDIGLVSGKDREGAREKKSEGKKVKEIKDRS